MKKLLLVLALMLALPLAVFAEAQDAAAKLTKEDFALGEVRMGMTVSEAIRLAKPVASTLPMHGALHSCGNGLTFRTTPQMPGEDVFRIYASGTERQELVTDLYLIENRKIKTPRGARIGMKRKDIYRLYGEPDNTYDNNAAYWYDAQVIDKDNIIVPLTLTFEFEKNKVVSISMVSAKG